MEQDVCALVLSVDVHIDEILFEERSAKEAFLAEVQRPDSPRKTTSMMTSSTRVTAAYAAEQDVGERVAGSIGALVAKEEVERDPSSNIVASLGVNGETISELLRLDGCLEM